MSKKLIQAAAGAGGESVYVEDVFSTYLYEGTGSALDITNNIDLSGEGGAVWIKNRTNASNHALFDTERGAEKLLFPDDTAAEQDRTADNDSLGAFNSDGFSLQASSGNRTNESGSDFVSWSFRKQAGFFDVVTYTGNSTSGRGIAHNLGSTPGFVIVKCTSDAEVWRCFHRTFSASDDLSLNSTAAVAANGHFPTVPDSDNFYVGAGNQVNGTGKTYVAYLFAHDDQSFGDGSDEPIIKCGSFTEPSSGSVSINLGFEPQFVLAKPSSTSGDWYLFDIMRGMPVSPATARLSANSSSAEVVATSASGPWPLPTATGFDWKSGFVGNETWIYIAIRRPMKTPESGTEVFKPVARTGTGAEADVSAGFAADLSWSSERGTVYSGARLFFDKLRGAKNRLDAAQTSSEVSGGTSADMLTAFTNDGVTLGSDSNWYINKSGNPYVHWLFKRATGFFDVVAYTGTGATGQVESHNLGTVPEMIIVKNRGSSWQWAVYHKDLGEHDSGSYIASKNLTLNTTDAETTNSVFSQHSDQTASVFTLGYTNSAITYASGNNYIAYLFATLAGVSKVGSYTGTGTTNNIDCGFSAGARFVMIKSTSAGDWQIFDTARGIVSGNDPRLLVRANQAEDTATDYLDYYASGFSLTSNTNVNNNSSNYIFLAIA